MENALLIGLSRQAVLRRSLDVIANNIANVNTTGFKADNSVFEETTMPLARDNGGNGINRRVSFVNDRATWHDMRQGGIELTGAPLDVAIDGNGFLAVQTPAGERYTRNGSLQLNAAGELVTATGFRVLGESGPIVMQREDKDITIARDGSISAGANARGKLRIVEFAQAARLEKDGANTFVAPAGVTPTVSTTPRVIQGAVEKSNVQSVVEMTRMIDVTRTYTTISQMLQNQSDLRRSAIEKLAEVPA
jgi:flagellar basal-body rod protein FlgF/flagellar basal-body rod protein FlgG